MRLFVGIPLGSAASSALEALVCRLRPHAKDLRWTAPASWHFTLEFLGAATPPQYDQLLIHLAAVRHAPIAIHLDRPGIFDRAGVFHTAIARTPPLAALQSLVAAAVALCGFVPDARPYHPHITLARAKGPDRLRTLRALEPYIAHTPTLPGFTAHEFLLYESHLLPAGAEYEVRARFPLRVQPAAPSTCS